MQDFGYIAAKTVSEAVALLDEKGQTARILAGGTDLIVQVREARRDVDWMIDIKSIPEVNVLDYNADTGLTLGTAVECYKIYAINEICDAYPGLIDATKIIGGTAIQGRAGVGGNLCNASPAADCIPPLIVLNASCVIAGPNGEREVPVEQFCTAPGQTALENGEMLVSMKIPAPESNSSSFYLRFIPRNEMDIAVVGAGASVTLDDAKQKIVSARIALAAVAPTPLFAEEASSLLAGQEVSDTAIDEAAQAAQAIARPISDMRGTAEQRTHLVGVLTRRALNGAIQRIRDAA
jgi:carbon-monoxide dehydrogenase medium subunit